MHPFTGPIVATSLAATFAFLASPGFAAEKAIELPPFTSVDISSGIDAEIAVGATQSIVAESPDPVVLDRLQIRVVDGQLKAWFDWSIFDLFSLGTDRPITLKISVPALSRAEASSGADVTVTGMTGDALNLEASSGAGLRASGLAGGTVVIEASSGAGVDAAGTCTSGTFEVSSGADIKAATLLCADATAEASSGAHADIFASTSINAEASSGGDVTVHGSPSKVDSETSSGGDVEIAQ